jgi:hypothetical protein
METLHARLDFSVRLCGRTTMDMCALVASWIEALCSHAVLRLTEAALLTSRVFERRLHFAGCAFGRRCRCQLD